MPSRDELLDALARADRLALAAHLRAEDGPVRDVLVELRGRLRELAGAVALRPYRWLRPASFLVPFAATIGIAAGLGSVLPWYLAAPAAGLAGLVLSWPLRSPAPDVDLAARDVPAPEAVGLPALIEELSATTARATAVLLTWRVGLEPAAPLALHADACLARLGAGLAPPSAPGASVDDLRPLTPWLHALVHDAHGGVPARLARMDAAYRLVAHHAPPTRAKGPSRWAWLAVPAGAYAAVVPSPWLLALVPLAGAVAWSMRTGPDSCRGLCAFNRESDAGAIATEAARKLEDVARGVDGPVAEDLRRARDLLRGRGST